MLEALDAAEGNPWKPRVRAANAEFFQAFGDALSVVKMLEGNADMMVDMKRFRSLFWASYAVSFRTEGFQKDLSAALVALAPGKKHTLANALQGKAFDSLYEDASAALRNHALSEKSFKRVGVLKERVKGKDVADMLVKANAHQLRGKRFIKFVAGLKDVMVEFKRITGLVDASWLTKSTEYGEVKAELEVMCTNLVAGDCNKLVSALAKAIKPSKDSTQDSDVK